MHSNHNLADRLEEYVGAVLVLGIMCGAILFVRWLVRLAVRFLKRTSLKGNATPPEKHPTASTMLLQNTCSAGVQPADNPQNVGGAGGMPATLSTSSEFCKRLAATQSSAKRISFWISVFGWIYVVIYWICDTVVVLSGETKLVNYLWFCQRGVIGIALVYLAKQIKRLPINTVALLTVVLGILIVRANLMVLDKAFGHAHLINLFDETYSPAKGNVSGWGVMFILISYIWRGRTKFKETQAQFPQIFNGIANSGATKRTSAYWKYILGGMTLILLMMFGCSVVQRLINMQPFVNVTEKYAVTQVPNDQDSRMPARWTRYAIGDLATIDIPPSMELRTDEQLLETMKQKRAQMGLTTEPIVFQQLGYISRTGHSKYARVLISVFEDTFDFGRDLRTLSSEKKAKLDVQEQERWRSEYKLGSGIKLISVSQTVFGESYTQNSYMTQMEDNPVVCGNQFSYYGRGKKVEIKLLYREMESEYFEEDFAHIPQTFQFR